MIETERLIIRPLTYNQLKKHLYSPDELAVELQIIPSKDGIDEAVREAIIHDFLPHLEDSDKDFRFYTMWIVIEKSSRKLAGGICFHGEANEDGEVEIGYGTVIECRNKGIMTETISGMIQWLKVNTIVKAIKAETDRENISSMRVLENNHFKISQENDEMIIFKLQL
jgi:[ribosomal protein S5]-alanine N-acetyltransferase